MHARAVVKPFEHRHIRVRRFVVAVDAGIGDASENFIITGVGKFLTIRHGDDAAFVLIAKKLAMPGNLCPEEGEQCLAAALRRIAPEFTTQCVNVFHAPIFFGD